MIIAPSRFYTRTKNFKKIFLSPFYEVECLMSGANGQKNKQSSIKNPAYSIST